MNRYLTERARERRGWEIPVALLSAVLGAIAIQNWVQDPVGDDGVFIWALANLVVTGVMLLPLYRIGRKWLWRRRAAKLSERLAACPQARIPLKELDKALGISGSAKKIVGLVRRGYLQNVTIDGGFLLLNAPAAAPAAAPAPEPVRVNETDVIRQIRKLNDDIDDEAVSRQIDRIESVTASILRTLRERPEREEEARRFMNYYLPTTLKLLESYRLMEDQSYQGQNIQASRGSIEAVLEKLVTAAELQQDRLFRSEALDVESDIAVLETMMASDGLTKTRGLGQG